MEAYQKSFMELDLACRGFLEIDALKVIMVLRGSIYRQRLTFHVTIACPSPFG